MSEQNKFQVSVGTTSAGVPVYRMGGIEFVNIPEGKFIMGSTSEDPLAHRNEMPQFAHYLSDYWMARYPVTNEQYAQFVERTGYIKKGSPWLRMLKEMPRHSVTNVTWYDAAAFCEWFNLANKEELDEAGGLRLFLPSEAEWEKAARGTDGRQWPWGNEFDPEKCNANPGERLIEDQKEERGPTPVGKYSPQGDSPYGCADMAGNVWEFTRTCFKYPHSVDDDRSVDMFSQVSIRGGAFGAIRKYTRCAYRDKEDRNARSRYYGFRVCLLPKITAQKHLVQLIRAE